MLLHNVLSDKGKQDTGRGRYRVLTDKKTTASGGFYQLCYQADFTAALSFLSLFQNLPAGARCRCRGAGKRYCS